MEMNCWQSPGGCETQQDLGLLYGPSAPLQDCPSGDGDRDGDGDDPNPKALARRSCQPRVSQHEDRAQASPRCFQPTPALAFWHEPRSPLPAKPVQMF